MVRRSGALALLIAVAACAPAAAKHDPVSVNVRVEGLHKTLFEGRVTTIVHEVNSHDGSGSHKCDGTNGGASKKPGPTLLGAFDTAMLRGHIGWEGQYFASFEDFTIDRVGPDEADVEGGHFWGQALNYKDTEVGGCQLKVENGDDVLVAYDSFQHPKLKLIGPKRVEPGERFRVTVLNGATGAPYAGARVRGKESDAGGHVRLKFVKPGHRRFKARDKGAIRSNRLHVRVSED